MTVPSRRYLAGTFDRDHADQLAVVLTYPDRLLAELATVVDRGGAADGQRLRIGVPIAHPRNWRRRDGNAPVGDQRNDRHDHRETDTDPEGCMTGLPRP